MPCRYVNLEPTVQPVVVVVLGDQGAIRPVQPQHGVDAVLLGVGANLEDRLFLEGEVDVRRAGDGDDFSARRLNPRQQAHNQDG